MVSKLITGFAWRHEQVIYFSYFFLESPKNMEIHVRIFKLINLFFILYLNIGRFLSTKTSEIRKQRRIQNALEAPIYQNFLGDIPRTTLTRRGSTRRGNPFSCSPPLVPLALDLVFAGPLFRAR